MGALTTLCPERARGEARASEKAYRRGRSAGSLAGVPFVVKDLFDSADVPTQYGSPMFARHTPAADAAVVRHVREAGGIMLGKAQTHEFAWGITSVNELTGTSRNPWDRRLMSGGSSGGSAVALAAHMVPLAIGSDTGGSIRVPSAFCGTVGFKPTFGRLSTEGVWPLAPSLDHPGPMARTPADAALLLACDGGRETAPALDELERTARRGLAGRRVGVCADLHAVPLARDVQAAFDDAVRTVGELGAASWSSLCRTRTRSIPPSASSSAPRRCGPTAAGLYPSRKDEYGDDVRGRLEAAEQVTFDDYLRATATREQARASLAALFRSVDVLLTPVAAGSPVPIGASASLHGREIDFRELVMTYTVPQDLLGIPGLRRPGGLRRARRPDRRPVHGPAWDDLDVLAVAQAFFAATPELQERWPERREGDMTTGADRTLELLEAQVGRHVSEVETPVAVVDLDRLDANLSVAADLCGRARHRALAAHEDAQVARDRRCGRSSSAPAA